MAKRDWGPLPTVSAAPRRLQAEPRARIFLATSWAPGLFFKRLQAGARGLCFRLLAGDVSEAGKSFPGTPTPRSCLRPGKCAVS